MDAAWRGVCWLAAAPKTRWQYANRDGRDRSSRGRRNLVRCDRWSTDVTCRSHRRPLTPKRAHYLLHHAQLRITRCAGRLRHLIAPCYESHGAGRQRPSLQAADANSSHAGGLEPRLVVSPSTPGGRSRFRHSFWRPAWCPACAGHTLTLGSPGAPGSALETRKLRFPGGGQKGLGSETNVVWSGC